MTITASTLSNVDDAQEATLPELLDSPWLSCDASFQSFSSLNNERDSQVFHRRDDKTIWHLRDKKVFIKAVVPTPMVALERRIYIAERESSSDEEMVGYRNTIRCSDEELASDFGFACLLAQRVLSRKKAYCTKHKSKTYTLHHQVERSDDAEIATFFHNRMIAMVGACDDTVRLKPVLRFCKKIFFIQAVMILLSDLDQIFREDVSEDNAFVRVTNNDELLLEHVDIESGKTKGVSAHSQSGERLSKHNFEETFYEVKSGSLKNLGVFLKRIGLDESLKEQIIRLAGNQYTLVLWSGYLSIIMRDLELLLEKIQSSQADQLKGNMQGRFKTYLEEVHDQLVGVLDYDQSRIDKLNEITVALHNLTHRKTHCPNLCVPVIECAHVNVDLLDMMNAFGHQIVGFEVERNHIVSENHLKLFQMKHEWLLFIHQHKLMLDPSLQSCIDKIDALIQQFSVSEKEVNDVKNQFLAVNEVSDLSKRKKSSFRLGCTLM